MLRSPTFSVQFYRVFWEVIKDNLMDLFHAFHTISLPLYNLNFEVIKFSQNVKMMCGLNNSHICFLNMSFRVFTKVGRNTINQVVEYVVLPTQMAS